MLFVIAWCGIFNFLLTWQKSLSTGIYDDCHERVACIDVCTAAAPVGSDVTGIAFDGSVSVNEFYAFYKTSFSHIEGTVLVISSSKANGIIVGFLPHVCELNVLLSLPLNKLVLKGLHPMFMWLRSAANIRTNCKWGNSPSPVSPSIPIAVPNSQAETNRIKGLHFREKIYIINPENSTINPTSFKFLIQKS